MMNKKETKSLIKESLVSPSVDFTDELMEKIEMESQLVKVFPWPVVLLSISCVVFFILLIFLVTKAIPEFTFYDISIKISPLFIQISGTLFILFVIDQIIGIYQNMDILNKNVG